ncbi:ATP-binding protein [Streptomyces sp. MS2.AVA.5]|uniref:BTAD domain-containing putative transcriptional regulator n=1 Tax=Streptomyces achmelvichensis TaxID=3134111 RepID=A0ACC6PPJ2_9ACTN
MTHRYHVLGPTQVLRPDGTEARLGGARLRALLTALAAGGGRAVSPAELSAQLWEDDEQRPADAPAALQALVGRLRRTLGAPSVDLLPGGYRLAAVRDDIDLFRFERLAAQGAAALDAGHAEEAAAVLDEALALWRGPALADLPGRESDPLAVRAERRRTEARRARIAADIALGRAAAVLPELAALAAESPLDEPLQVLHIRALAATGRTAQALQEYEGVRVRIAKQLGADPGPELRTLHSRLLSGDARPSPPAATTRRGNPPAGLTSFVGRTHELAELAGALEARRLVTLTGPGGAGKTRLALEAARAAAATWPDGVWVAALAGAGDESTVAEAVLTALGARETQVRGPSAAETVVRDPLTHLIEHCARRRMLLVLDNCEHVIGAAARLAEALLTGCPGVRVLATSREPLGVPGETVQSVGPLPQDVALVLLGDRGAAVRAGFRTDEDPAACAEICRRLDGLPLALELAAARLRALTPRQIADRLDDRFRLLTGGGRTVLPRQQTLRAVVDWSWDLLDAQERTVLRRLAVFSGGCALPQAEEVCGPGALDGLAGLVDKSLVVAVPDGPDGMRYRLLETVAEYAGERLTEAGERSAVERRHLRAYRELARAGEPELRGPGQADWLDRFEAEHDNVRAALRTAVRLHDEQEALCLALSMSWFWQQRAHQADARAWSAAVAELGPDPFRAPVRAAEPMPARCTDLAPPWPVEVLWEARRGLRLMVIASDDRIGTAMDDPATQEYLRAVVAAYRPGLPQLCRQPATMWFFARLMTGEFAGLAETFDAIVAGSDGQAEGWDLALLLLMRAKVIGQDPADPARPATDADRALALFRRSGDQWGIAESLSARGEEYDRRGRYEEAAADFEAAMRSSARVGAGAQVLVLRSRLAGLALKTAGNDEERADAERQLLEVIDRSEGFTGEVLSTARMALTRYYGAIGRTGPARGQLEGMERELSASAPGLFRGLLVGMHGWLACVDGAYAQARDRIRDAVGLLDTMAHLVAPHLVADQFLCAAWAMAHLDAAEDGARLLGAYDSTGRQPGGFGFQPFDDQHEVRRRAESDLRGVLGDERYTQAHRAGRGLSGQEACALI